MFTVLSFLTTTGFVSSEWEAAQGWSGLATPGVILMGLALMGGGVATTAGGVKLLRVFTLYLNGLREMQKAHSSFIGQWQRRGQSPDQAARGVYCVDLFHVVCHVAGTGHAYT